MKKIIKNMLLSVVAVVFMISAEVFAFAETKTADLVTLDSDTNLTVSVGYETEEPTVSFIAPNGDEVKEGSEGVEVKRDTEGKKIYFQISNAKRGDWKIVYDKKSNSQITVDFGKFSNGIWINSVTPGKLEGNTLEVSLDVSQTENIRYDYKLYAAVVDADGVVTGKKLLSSGSAVANEVVNTTVDLSPLGSSSYYIFAEISTTDKGVYVFDEMLSDAPVNFTNADALPKVDDLYVELNLSTNEILISWENYCSSNDEKIIGIFGNGEQEPMFSYTATGYEKNLVADIDSSKLPFTVEFTYKDGNRISETFTKTIDVSDVKVTMKNDGLVNSFNALFDYETSKETTFDISVDGAEPYQVVGNGNGNFSVKLSQNLHEITVSHLRSDNIKVINKYQVIVDDVAPEMEFFENLTTIRTHNETFDIIGSVEAGASLTVDGKEIKTEENGVFRHNVALKEGDNRFEFVAVDGAGNKTLRRIEIIREPKTIASSKAVDDDGDDEGFFKKYLALIITAGVSLIVAVVAIILSMKKKVTDNKKFLYTGIMIFVNAVAVLSLIGIVALLIYRYNLYKEIGPENFLKALDSSMNEAYENILKYNNIGEYLTILLVVFIVATVISLVMALGIIIPKKLKNRKPKIKKTAEKPTVSEDVKVETITEKPEEKPQEAPKTEGPKFCKKCGTPLGGAKFCKKCGEKAY